MSPPKATMIMVDGTGEFPKWEVVSDISQGIQVWNTTRTRYLVSWLGWGHEHNTWEPKSNLKNAPWYVARHWAHDKLI
jgi:hypothetical protein